MKVSAWYKQLGDTVQLLRLEAEDRKVKTGNARLLPPGPFQSVWVSVVFEWNRQLAQSVASYYAEQVAFTQIGGSGFDIEGKLPDNIENMIPDYLLYKIRDKKGELVYDDRAIGFMQRGCIRACDFCYVNRKEGWLKDNVYRGLETWVPDGFKKILLLDNEFAAFPFDRPELERMKVERNWHFEATQQEILETVKSHGWKLSITQGYDLRCVTPEKAALLASVKPWAMGFNEPTLYCAWDYYFIEPYVRQGLKMLRDAGFKGREIVCYCLVGHNTTHQQDYNRFRVLWDEYEVRPFVMKFNKRMDDRFLNVFAHYINRGRANYAGHSFSEHCRHRAPDVLSEALELERNFSTKRVGGNN